MVAQIALPDDATAGSSSAGGSTPKKRPSVGSEDGTPHAKGAMLPPSHTTTRAKRVAIESLFSERPMEGFRKDYRNFRRGMAKGAKGEVGDERPATATAVAAATTATVGFDLADAPRHRRVGSSGASSASTRGARGSKSMLDLTVLREGVAAGAAAAAGAAGAEKP